MGNNENEDYGELINSVVESIKNRKNKRNKNTEDDGEYNYYRLLDFFEETEDRADDYLKRINIQEISKKFVLIQETDNNILIDRLLNEKYISNSDRKEVEEYIHKIKKESLKQLVNLSFIKNDKVFLTVLKLLISQFKEPQQDKILLPVRKELIIFVAAHETKFILKKLKNKLEDHMSTDYTQLYDNLYDKLIDCFEYVNRIGYLQCVLESEEKLGAYLHSVVSRKYKCDSNAAARTKLETFLKDMKEEIQKQAIKYYANINNSTNINVNIIDNVALANQMRKTILEFIDNKNSGKIVKPHDNTYTTMIDIVTNYKQRNNSNWNDIKKFFIEKEKDDIFFESVKVVCPKNIRV